LEDLQPYGHNRRNISVLESWQEIFLYEFLNMGLNCKTAPKEGRRGGPSTRGAGVELLPGIENRGGSDSFWRGGPP